MRWSPELTEAVRARYEGGAKRKEVEAEFGLTPGQFEGARMRFNFHRANRNGSLRLAGRHPAVVEGRTIFPGSVKLSKNVLKPGSHSPKLGSKVEKGAWRGFPIYSLTLEERATCPKTCRHWRDCYGNRMHLAARQPATMAMGMTLWVELFELNETAERKQRGFVVRLHVLGDFYSDEYVDFWRRAMFEFPALHVFGYTAHDPRRSNIGRAVARMKDRFPGRWRVRFSYGPPGSFRTGDDGITCPVQTGKTKSCATCALCWSTDKAIRFEDH